MNALLINDSDNLVVALKDLKRSENIEVNGVKIHLNQDVPAKHKFTIQDCPKGSELYMYGVVVGTAQTDIPMGMVITTQNVKHKASTFDLDKQVDFKWEAPDISMFKDATFNGYHRSDGQVGTDNIWLVFPLVFCENRNIEVLKKAFERALGYEQVNPYEAYVSRLVDNYQRGAFESNETEGISDFTEQNSTHEVFDNVKIRFVTHHSGCGGTRQDAEMLCKLLAGYVNHPNVAGATVLSLGCQNAQVSIFQESVNTINPNFDKPLIILDQQGIGSERDLIAEAITKTFSGLVEADRLRREPAPLSKLTIGLECGGSDGFSGISANPVLGYVSDLLAGLGGKAILSEFPELCGVEQELINRMPNQSMAKKFAHLMTTYASAAEASGSGFDMNPSPGNIKDGLITDAMKSAGAAKKGGTSPVKDVLDYGEYAKENGLNLLCTPGNDVESTTGLVGSGANIVLFTTGLGTPTGNPVAPVLKVSSNTKLAERMSDIIDINTGAIIEGEKTIPEMGKEVLFQVIAIASGEVESKANQMRQYDFIPWKRGVSL